MKTSEIAPEEYNPYYQAYIERVEDGDLYDLLFESHNHVRLFYNELPKDKYVFRYEDGKWTPLEILQHIIDTERVFNYRALRFGRMDATPLVGFDHDTYINPSLANDKTLSQLIQEYEITRQHSLSLFKSLSPSHLSFIGMASGSPMSARAVMAIIIGHEKHHIQVIKERYLNV